MYYESKFFYINKYLFNFVAVDEENMVLVPNTSWPPGCV